MLPFSAEIQSRAAPARQDRPTSSVSSLLLNYSLRGMREAGIDQSWLLR